MRVNRKIAIENLAILQTGDLPAILRCRRIFALHPAQRGSPYPPPVPLHEGDRGRAHRKNGLRLVWQSTCQFPQKSMSIFGVKITLVSCSKGAIDFNYQRQIQGLIYGFLAKSNPEYASSLHKHGYVYERDKRFKLFVFSGIIFDKPIKVIGSNRSISSNSLNGL